jgi:hypothetical protein
MELGDKTHNIVAIFTPSRLFSQGKLTFENIKFFIDLQQFEGGPCSPALLLSKTVIYVTFIFWCLAHFLYFIERKAWTKFLFQSTIDPSSDDTTETELSGDFSAIGVLVQFPNFWWAVITCSGIFAVWSFCIAEKNHNKNTNRKQRWSCHIAQLSAIQLATAWWSFQTILFHRREWDNWSQNPLAPI